MKQFKLLKNTFITSLLILLTSFTNELGASHLLGGDIQYECIGSNQYIVSLILYRDCNGIPMGSQRSIDINGTCINTTAQLSLASNFPQDVTGLCPHLPTACNGGNGTYGVEQFLYTDTISIPSTCTEVTLSFRECCRNSIINTIVDPGNTRFYIQAKLDHSLANCDNSPQFLNVPSIFVCEDQPVYYDLGMFDPDGDSLFCSIISSQSDAGTNVNYDFGYSATFPFATPNGISINPHTGILTFTPSAQQTGVLAILVEEFRNGVKIGEVVRDVQLTIIHCFNNPPDLSGINGYTNYDTLVNSGSFCFDVYGTDLDTNNLTIFWDNAIPSASFTVANNSTPNAVGTFCWTPTAADEGVHQFNVTIQDDHCPLLTQEIYTYTIAVSCVHSNVEKLQKQQLIIFPNPARDALFIQPQKGNWYNTTVQITNMHGQLCFQQRYQQLPASLAIDRLPVGHYILSLHPDNSNPIHLQFMKQ